MSTPQLKEAISQQFNRQVGHYLQQGPMGDRLLLERIVELAAPRPADRVLDVACGAGLLAAALAPMAFAVAGIDLSSAMLAAARETATRQGVGNVTFQQGDSELLPFVDGSFELVTCKLALHYFPDPDRALKEMRRVLATGGRIVLVDRVAAENADQRAYHNRIELLRTPTKKQIYTVSEIQALLERHELTIDSVTQHEQYQAADEWLGATGASPLHHRAARELLHLSVANDLAGLGLFYEGDRLMMTHTTVIFVAGA